MRRCRGRDSGWNVTADRVPSHPIFVPGTNRIIIEIGRLDSREHPLPAKPYWGRDRIWSMSQEDTDRTEGVNFSDMEPIFEELSYPVTADEILAEYGEHELQRTNAEPIALKALLGPLGETEFNSDDDLQTMILGQMPEDSEGREHYSDRGGSSPVATEDAEEANE